MPNTSNSIINTNNIVVNNNKIKDNKPSSSEPIISLKEAAVIDYDK